jgi:predicted dienelactone hydrolase
VIRSSRWRPGLVLAVVGVSVAIAAVLVYLGPFDSSSGERGTATDTIGTVPIDGVDVPESTDPVVPVSKVSVDTPAAVGTTTLELVDPTRPTEARGDAEAIGSRYLRVVVRYPIAGVASGSELENAVPLGTSPLIVFAHGYNASTATYAALLHDLAASGFVVAAVEFPLTSSAYPGYPVEMDLVNEPADISFIIDALTSETPPVPLGGAISKSKVGVIGHSDGAMAVLLTAYAPKFVDRRIGMVVSIAGGYDTYGGEWFSTSSAPLLVIHGTLDEITPFSRSEELAAADPHAVMFVAVEGANHLASATAPEFEPSVARLVSGSFAWHLLGSVGSAAGVLVDGNTPPLTIVALRG